MAAGAVEVRVVDATVAAVDTALTAMRVTATMSGAYLMTSINNGQKILLAAITETA